jgi:hypothetical protein
MAFITDYGVLPNGSVWKKRYWAMRDGDKQLKMALETGDVVYRHQ